VHKKVPLAIGLTGVNVCNVKELIDARIIDHQDDLFNIEKNIDAGHYMLEKYIRTAGDYNITLALKYYFNGPANVKKDPNRPDYLVYVADVYNIMGQFVSKIEVANLKERDAELASN
jgi:hypothetical protein